jgi:hypothetical protein
MATLVVFEFPTAEGADTMLNTLEGLQKQQLIQINDGAVVTGECSRFATFALYPTHFSHQKHHTPRLFARTHL